MVRSVTEFLTAFASLAPRPLIAVGVATGIILLVPDGIAQKLGVDTFRAMYRGYLGAAFILSWSYLVAHLVWWFRGRVAAWHLSRRKRLIRERWLHELTPAEKSYLAPYILQDVTTRQFQIEDGVANGLAAKEILARASQVGSMVDGFAYAIQPWAKRYLKGHPDLLAGGCEPEYPEEYLE
jgi:hypothetical protein